MTSIIIKHAQKIATRQTIHGGDYTCSDLHNYADGISQENCNIKKAITILNEELTYCITKNFINRKKKLVKEIKKYYNTIKKNNNHIKELADRAQWVILRLVDVGYVAGDDSE